jgi:hypothetical protein
MPELQFTVSHQLTQSVALARLQADIKQNSQRPEVRNLQASWEENRYRFSCTALVFNVSGQLEVLPSAIQIDLLLPMTAWLMKGMVEQQIREHLDKLLAPTEKNDSSSTVTST